MAQAVTPVSRFEQWRKQPVHARARHTRYPGDKVLPALRDLEKSRESTLERCDKAVDCHESS